MTEKIACPYCKGAFRERVTPQIRCPKCGNIILVRKGNLLTQEEADIEDWVRRVEYLGVTVSYFREQWKAARKQLGEQPELNDVAWQILNNLLLTKRRNRSAVYLEMAYIARSEGKDPNPYLAEANRETLLSFQADPAITRVRVRHVNDRMVCPTCLELEGREWIIEEALQNPPIPGACTNEGGCRCYYQPVTV